MHATFFRMKRAHYSSVRVAREILKDHALSPLTPARFDLLYLVHLSVHGFIPQGELTRRLGLHPSTVSKMLTRLDELGLAYRQVHEDDGRERDVVLTDEGKALMRRALQAVSDGYPNLVVNAAIAPLFSWNDRKTLRKIRRTHGTLRRYALALNDTAAPLYAPVAV